MMFLSSCQYTHSVVCRLLGPHGTLSCVLIYVNQCVTYIISCIVVVIIGSYETRENSSEVTLILTLSQESSQPFEVVLTTMDITATGMCIGHYLYILFLYIYEVVQFVFL